MPFINTIDYEEASDRVKAMYDKQMASNDYLPNYAKVFCFHPEVMEAWANLQQAIRQSIESRRYELVTLATAQTIGSSYCSLAYGNKVGRKYLNEDQLLAMLDDIDHSDISADDKAMMKLAKKVAANSCSVTEEDIEQLRQQGFSEADIFSVVASAAARCFFAKLVDGLGAQPDPIFNSMKKSLKDRLVVGRPIADE